MMFTDMVGYTALAQSDESQAMAVLDRHNRLLRPFFPKYRGREVKSIGDSFMVEFDSALDATTCAVEIQRFLHDYNISSKNDWKITLRIGVHLGDVVHSDRDIFGDAVNIASRLQPLAEPEGVCVSDQVFGQVRNKISQDLVKLAPQDLKNVKFPIDVYKVVMPWDVETGEFQLDRMRVAVLPFANMSSDPEEGYFADGVTEELMTSLSSVKQLTIIARTSMMRYRSSQKSASDVGKELNAGTLIEGSVRKAGNRVRVTAQLIDAATEGHLWAQNYDRELEDVFAIQSEIAEKVAGELKIRLVESERRAIEAKATDNVEAYALYLRAMQLFHESDEDSLREACTLFNSAISKDPSFSRAYASLAHALRRLAAYGSYTELTSRAEEAASKALELAPGSAEAHAAMAAVHSAMDRFDEERRELEVATRINPNLPEANALLGEVYCTFGRFDEGLAYYQKAYAQDPLSPVRGTFLSHALRVVGRVDEALDLLRRLEELHPNNPRIRFGIATCYMQRKEYDKAAEALEVGLRIAPTSPDLRMAQGMLYAMIGRRKEAEEVLHAMSTAENSQRELAQLYIKAYLGDLDGAFEALMQMAEDHSWFSMVKFDPLSEAFRKDPRFSEFCKKVGLPP